MNNLIKGNLRSKTSWFGSALVVAGAILEAAPGFVEQYLPVLLAVVPPEYGKTLSVIGAAVVALRNVTNKPVTEKAAKQGGFANPLLLALLVAIAVPLALVLPGCATTSPQTQLILETTTRMAVRRSLADSDRAIEKAANIRAVAERLQGTVTAESTIMGLRDEVMREIARLDLHPLDRADAVDMVDLFAAILEENYGGELAGDERMVKVRAFLDIVLSTLPAV